MELVFGKVTYSKYIRPVKKYFSRVCVYVRTCICGRSSTFRYSGQTGHSQPTLHHHRNCYFQCRSRLVQYKQRKRMEVRIFIIVNSAPPVFHNQSGQKGGVPSQGGGGGTLIFSAYIGSDPASTVHPKKYQEF